MAEHADRVERLGVGRITGAILRAGLVSSCWSLSLCTGGTSTTSPQRRCFWWEAFYRTGSIIFGGGQVAPLLHIERAGLHLPIKLRPYPYQSRLLTVRYSIRAYKCES